MPTTIKVNGVDRIVDVDDDTPLLWVLRDVLGMTGTKFGCGAALCGACTVHVDGAPTRSCITSIDSIGTSEITTIEAIGATSDRSPSANGLSRRRFVQAGAVAGGGLMLSLSPPFANGGAEAADAAGFAPNAFIRIEGDGQIVLTMPYVEMGQGTYTSIAMLIAEELEVDLKQVRLEHAPPNEKLYGNPALGGIQATGNSNAMRAAWQPLRQAGAIARTMLVAAAAKRWDVDPASCRAQSGEVRHPPTRRSIKYGALAAAAAGMPVPESVMLKRPADFKVIGTPAKRLDAPAKVNGTAVYGIDVRPPGVKIATLAQSPVFGGRVKSVNDAAARAVKGVRQIVRLDDAVAVVADHMGAAKKERRRASLESFRYARATRDHAAAALRRAMNWRRLMCFPPALVECLPRAGSHGPGPARRRQDPHLGALLRDPL